MVGSCVPGCDEFGGVLGVVAAGVWSVGEDSGIGDVCAQALAQNDASKNGTDAYLLTAPAPKSPTRRQGFTPTTHATRTDRR
jgi:hypothetical protein